MTYCGPGMATWPTCLTKRCPQNRTSHVQDQDRVQITFVTHLVEFDYPQKFVQDQCGHSWGSTTAIYTGVSDEYRNRLVQRALKDRHAGDLWEDQP